MKTTINKLYNGNLCPCEQNVKSHDYWDLHGDVLRHKDTFIEKLEDQAPELTSRFTDLIDDLTLMHAMELEHMFGHGFSLGMKLLAEATNL